MPSPIFEFRRAVHDSPSVMYHPPENVRIRPACVFQATENQAAGSKSLPVICPTPTPWCLTERGKKEGRHNYFCGSAAAHTAHTAQITHQNSSRESPDYLAVIPIRKREKESLQAPGLSLDSQTHHNDVGFNKIKNEPPKKDPESKSQSFNSIKRTTGKIFFGSDCKV